MIKRAISEELLDCCTEYPVITVFGPRQSGKTVLVLENFPDKPYYLLEDPDTRQAAEMDPRGFLGQMKEGAVLDEIQRVPALLSYIQGIVDKAQQPGMFILTGSHQPDLHKAISQSLAGRTALLTLLPFSLEELQQFQSEWDAYDLIVKGAFPRLHEKNLKPERFFNGYLQTYVERDVRALINLKDLNCFQHFLTLLAGRISQVINYTSLSNDTGVSATTIKNWISVLKASYVVFELPPFFENIRERVVKSPKLYFTDTGLAAFLLGIRTAEQAARDPLRGGLYENLIILEIMKYRLNQGRRPDLYFFRDTHGSEVDLLIREEGKLFPVEIKSSATFSKSFLKGIERFRGLTSNCRADGAVLYNGDQQFQVKDVHFFNLLKHHKLS
ncbi:MAG: ATP-binding protein [Bacteroidia bacterium]|nr:MAG: ATP-binding protein [Bacteroidia bacterium]